MGALVLTILLAIFWAAFVGLGYWQGGWRQVVFLAGMLLSYAVLTEWAVPNGHDLSAQFHWRLDRTTTGVALLYLLGGTLILGFLGGFVLERPRPLGARERQFGAVMGIINGGLLLALILRTLRSYAYGAGGGRLLRTTGLARFLIESIGYVLLVALVIGLIGVLVGLAIAPRARETMPASDVEQIAAQAIALQRQPAYEEPRPQPSRSPVLPEPPARPPIREPVYTSEPIIDWPTAPPPGTLIEPAAAANVAPPATAPEPKVEAARVETSSPLPAQPNLPRRVPPPMLYSVAELVAARPAPVRPSDTAPAVQATPALAPAAPLPMSAGPPPPVDMAPPVSAAEAPAPRPAAIPPSVRPTSPPPGAQHPAFIPPTVARPPQPASPPLPERAPTLTPTPSPIPQADTAPPIVRELDVATHDALPVVREIDVPTQEPPPPVVREVDVTTQDVPTVVPAPVASKEAPPAPPEPAAASVREEEEMKTAEPALSPPIVTPKAVTETAPMPLSTAVPPPLPPIPTSRTDAPPSSSTPAIPGSAAQQEETAKPRAGFARVAVARQPGARAEQPPGQQPAPQPPAEPDPLQPPLPTGPRVHACPICGYPVRDHARYCPNCGTRQRS